MNTNKKESIHYDREGMLKRLVHQNETYRLGKFNLSTLTQNSRKMKEIYLITLILEQIVKLPKINQLLEVGCGVGELTPLLRTISKSVIAFDLSDVAISIAKKQWGYFPDVRFIIGDGTNPMKIKLGTKSFDMIYIREFHPFTRDDYTSIKEANKIHKKILQSYLDLISKKGVIIVKHSEKKQQTIRPEKLNLTNGYIEICQADPRLVTIFCILLKNRVKTAITISKFFKYLFWFFFEKQVLYVIKKTN